jgi:MraZ protein
MFRGSAPATVDDKGRLKIPADFRRVLEERFGSELPEFFVTSVQGDRAQLYPLPAWLEVETRLAAAPSTDPHVARYLERVNFYGQQTRADNQGRLLLPQMLREKASLNGEVWIQAKLKHLEVWNRERFQARVEAQPFTDDDFRALAEHGI